MTMPGLSEVIAKEVRPNAPKAKPKTRIYSSDEAKQFGVELEPDWMMKVTPVDGGVPQISYITPEKWEIKGENLDIYVTPQGKEYPREVMEQLWGMRKGVPPTAPPVAPPGVISKPPYLGTTPAGIVAGIPSIQERGATALFERIFPDSKEAADVFNFAITDPEGFSQAVFEAGRTPDTENLLRVIGATPQEIHEFFTGKPPDIPEEAQAQYDYMQGLYQELESAKGKIGAPTEPGMEAFLEEYRQGRIANAEKAIEIFWQGLIAKGRTKDTEAILRAVGATDAEIEEIFAAPLEYVPESKAKDVWDAFVLSGYSLWHRGKQFFVSAFPEWLMNAIQPEQFPGQYWSKESREAFREGFESKYKANEESWDVWLKDHPELLPRPEWDKGVIYTLQSQPDVSKDPAYWGYIIADSALFSMAIMGTTLGVTAATRNPYVGMMAGMALATPPQAQDVYEDMIDSGATPEQAGQLAVPAGVFISGIEVLGDLPFLKALNPLFGRILYGNVRKQVAQQVAQSAIRKGIKTFGAIEIAEILEEVSQQAVQNAAVRTIDENRAILTLTDASEIAVRTAVATVPLALIGAGNVTRVTSKFNAEMEKEILKNIEALKAKGLSEYDAIQVALKELAQEPEGLATIEKAADELQKEVKLTEPRFAPPVAKPPVKAEAEPRVVDLGAWWQDITRKEYFGNLRVSEGIEKLETDIAKYEKMEKRTLEQQAIADNLRSDLELLKERASELKIGIRMPTVTPEVTPEQVVYEMEQELAGLKEWVTTEPATKLVNLIKKTGWYKGEVSNLTLKQYKDATGKVPLENILTADKKHVRWEYALDDVATELGYESGEALKAEIERVGEAQTRIKELTAEIARAEPVKPPEKPPTPRVSLIQQMEQFRSDMQVEVEAMKAAIKDLRGDEAFVAKEALTGIERELAYVERTLAGFEKRVDLPDATKLRQMIMAMAKYKGLTKGHLQNIYKDVAGRRQLRVIPQEQLVEVLHRVRIARPKRIKGSLVVTEKAEAKIQTLKQSLTMKRQMSDFHYKRLMHELGLTTDRYISQYQYLTQNQANQLIRVMNEDADFMGRQIKIADALANSPAIKALWDELRARLDKRRTGIELDGELIKTPHPLEDIRYFIMDLQNGMTDPLYPVWHLMNRKAHISNYIIGIYSERLSKLRGFPQIAQDEKAQKRISDYIAAKNNIIDKKPPRLNSNELVIANELEKIFKEFQPVVREERFLDAYERDPERPADAHAIREEIPNAPLKDINEAIKIYETQGRDSLNKYLSKKDWGIIKAGYEPLSIVNPNIYLKRYTPGTFGKRHIRSRKGLDYPAQDRTLFQRYFSYVNQMVKLSVMRSSVNQFIRIYNNNAELIKEPGAVGASITMHLDETLGHHREGGWFAKQIRRLYAQAMASVFFDPFKWARNKMQNLAFHSDRLRWLTLRAHKSLKGHRKIFFDAFISQKKGFKHDYLMRNYKPLPGLGKPTRFANKVSLYPWTDETNRQESDQMRLSRVEDALKTYHRTGNVKQLMKNSGLLELELSQQLEALEMLAQDTVDFGLRGLETISGEEAFALTNAEEVTANTHFKYDRSERAVAEMGAVGATLGNLLTFIRSWGQRIVLQGRKLKFGSDATLAERVSATKIIAGMTIVAFIVGELFRRLVGKKYNPYDPLNILSWTPGGLMLGAVTEIGRLIYYIGRAAQGDSYAMSQLTSQLPRVASITLPFYRMAIDGWETLTDTKNVDRLMLRKLRALIDEEYKVREDAYTIERDWLAMIQHAIFGGEAPEMAIPKNPIIDETREEHREQFREYDGMADEGSAFYIEDDDERREARREFLKENPEFADAKRLIEFYQLGIWDDKAMEEFKKLPWWQKYVNDIPLIADLFKPPAFEIEEGLIKNHQEYGRRVDEFGANSAEALLYRYDNPDYSDFRENEDTFGENAWQELDLTDAEVKRLRIIADNRELLDIREGYGDRHSDTYIEDEEERQKAYDKLDADNPDFKNNRIRMDVYGKGGSDAYANTQIEYMKIVDEHGGSSVQAKLFKLQPENADWFKWGQGKDIYDWGDLTDENVERLNLLVDFDKQFNLYESYGDTGSPDYIEDEDSREAARQKLVFTKMPDSQSGKLSDFGEAYYKIDAYSQGYSEDVIEDYLGFVTLPDWGGYRDRYKLEHPEWAEEYYSDEIGEGHTRIEFEDVKPEKRDWLMAEYYEQFQQWDNTAGKTNEEIEAMREELLEDAGFAEAWRRLTGYDTGIPENYMDDYVAYYKVAEKPEGIDWVWYEDEWFLQEHPDYYKDVWLGILGNKPKDFSDVPSREFWKTYTTEYTNLPTGKPRLDYRARNLWFDKEGVTLGFWKSIEDRGSATSDIDIWEEPAWVRGIMENLPKY